MQIVKRSDAAKGFAVLPKRWVVERTIGWLHKFRRLLARWEKDPKIHEAFLKLGCAMICFRLLHLEYC